MRRLFLSWLSVAMLLTAAACGERPPARFNSTDISGAQFGASLAALEDQNGKPFVLADFKDKALIVFFGYTACPDVCPTTLARFAELKKALGGDGERLQVVLVTLDPERDTAEKLGAYVAAFDPSFVGLTGDMPAIEAVARDFKVFFTRRKAGEAAPPGGHHHHDEAYLIDHSAGAYVFDRVGRVRLFVSDTASTAALVDDVRQLLAGR